MHVGQRPAQARPSSPPRYPAAPSSWPLVGMGSTVGRALGPGAVGVGATCMLGFGGEE